MLAAAGFAIEQLELIGNAVYPGCRWWAAQTAAEKRQTIFAKSCRPDTPPFFKKLMMLRAATRISLLSLGSAVIEPSQVNRVYIGGRLQRRIKCTVQAESCHCRGIGEVDVWVRLERNAGRGLTVGSNRCRRPAAGN